MTQSSNHFFLFRLYMQLSLSQTLPHIVIWACGGWNIPFVIIFTSVLGATIKETPLDASTLLTHGIVGTGTSAASSFKAVTHRLQNMLPLNLFLNYYRNEFHLNWKLREVRAFVLLCWPWCSQHLAHASIVSTYYTLIDWTSDWVNEWKIPIKNSCTYKKDTCGPQSPETWRKNRGSVLSIGSTTVNIQKEPTHTLTGFYILHWKKPWYASKWTDFSQEYQRGKVGSLPSVN